MRPRRKEEAIFSSSSLDDCFRPGLRFRGELRALLKAEAMASSSSLEDCFLSVPLAGDLAGLRDLREVNWAAMAANSSLDDGFRAVPRLVGLRLRCGGAFASSREERPREDDLGFSSWAEASAAAQAFSNSSSSVLIVLLTLTSILPVTALGFIME